MKYTPSTRTDLIPHLPNPILSRASTAGEPINAYSHSKLVLLGALVVVVSFFPLKHLCLAAPILDNNTRGNIHIPYPLNMVGPPPIELFSGHIRALVRPVGPARILLTLHTIFP